MQTEISRSIQDNSHLILYENKFILSGSHGEHRVLVLPRQGPNLRDRLRPKSMAVRMSSANANVMWSLRPMNSSSVAEKDEHIERPKKIRLDPDLWKAGELVMPMKADESLIGENLQSPAIYCAPERVHDQDPTFATNMWSYMCILAELYMGYALFYGSGNSSIVSCIVHALGPLPATWKGTYKAGVVTNDCWYDQDHELDPTASLEAKVARLRPEVDGAERALVISVFRKGLSYLPQGRLTARELLEDASFKSLMEI
ncbi:CMGC kinase [Fusarium coicis]|nr:CMGC kinase [Fusarium coicis]